MRLCVIAPCKDSSPGPARDSLAHFMADWTLRRGSRPTLVTSWLSSNVARVRNDLAARALAAPADVFVWVDDDIVFRHDDVARLIDANEDVVSGCYTQKVLAAQVVGGATPNGERRGELLECDLLGFGLLAMRRHVLAATVEARPFGCVAGESPGEDAAFCRWWRACGGRLWLHTGVDLGHVGLHIFRGGDA